MKSKHCFRRFAAAMACLMLCVLCMPGAALAKGYDKLPDTDRTCSITLSYKVDSQPVEGVRYSLYRVADMDGNVRLSLTEKFKDLQPLRATNLDPNDLRGSLNTTWTALAETLYQSLGDMEPDAVAVTNADGIATASGLDMGLWLVAGSLHTSGTAYGSGEVYYRPVPFLVSLPSWVEDENGVENWAYDVNVTSKPVASLTARRVLKIWDDGESQNVEHPAVTVQLMRNGVDYGAPVTLNDANSWRHDFGELEGADANGTPIRWTIRETTALGEDYTVSISQQGITLVVTNSYEAPVTPPPGPLEPTDPDPTPAPSTDPVPDPSPSVDPEPVESAEPPEEIEDPDVPMTDLPSLEEIEEPEVPLAQPDQEPDLDEPDLDELDDTDVPLATLPQTGQLWWPVPVLAVAGVAMFLFGLKRRSAAGYEE